MAARAIRGLVDIAASIAPTRKKKKTTSKVTNAVRNIVRASSSRARRPTGALTAFNHLGQMSRQSASVSSGTSFTSRGRGNHVVKVPFSSISNAHIQIMTGGSAQFQTGVGQPTSPFFDLGPGEPPFTDYTSMYHPFGIGIGRLAKAFARYRLSSLRISYVNTASTALGGSVILGFNTDPYDAVYSLSQVSPQVVSDSSVTITTPIWSSASMDVTPLLRVNNDWKYCRHNATDVGEQQRFDFIGQLLIAGIGLSQAHVNTVCGYLRFDGEIEFMSLQDTMDEGELSSRSVVPPPPSEDERFVSVSGPIQASSREELRGIHAQMAYASR